MPVDIEAIKKKLAQLNGQKGGDFAKNWWKPKNVGTYMVRIVPWQDSNGQPFKEIWYYKGIGRKTASGYGPFPVPTLAQYKKPDPIQELINTLRKEDQDSGNESNKEFLKKLYPKLTVVVPVIVRGEEDMGVRLWAITDIKKLYQQLLGYFVDPQVLEDTADYTDVSVGFDIKVTVVQSDRMFLNKPVNDILVELARKTSPLSKDEKQVKAWLSAIPKIEEIDPTPSFEDLKKRLNDWMADMATEEADVGEVGTERGSAGESKDLDKLSAELSVTKAKEPLVESKSDVEESTKPAKEKKPVAAKAKKADTEKDLDDMFKDLEQGN